MDLGCFSLSLAVADIKASRAFYETMGFKVIDGAEAQRFLVMKNGDSKIGLFQGMFTDNMMTFNPPDVRRVQSALKDAGYSLEKEAEEGVGAAHVAVKDPDGNLILLDQFED